MRLRRDSWDMTAVTQQCTACPSLAAAALEALNHCVITVYRLKWVPQRLINSLEAEVNETDYSVLRVRLVLMRLSCLPPMKVLSPQRLQNLQSASSASD